MIRTILTATVAATGLFAAAGLSQAASEAHVDADCNLTVDRDAMTNVDAHAVYLCLADTLGAGYLKGDKRWIPRAFIEDFRSWTPASTLPADPGFHGGRFLFTYVNPVGAEEYLKFADEDVAMPVGSVDRKSVV